MKNVLLINPPIPENKKIIRNTTCASESKGNYLLHSYDFILLSGVFSELGNMNYIDGLADSKSDHQIFDMLNELQPTLVITSLIDRLWEHDLNFLKKIAKVCNQNNIKLLVLGDAFLEEANCNMALDYADGIIYSPLELKAQLIFESNKNDIKLNPNLFGLYKKLPIASKKPALISMPTPRHDLFLKNKYRFPFGKHKQYATVNTTWGCPYACNYCPASNLSVYYRSAQEIFEELLSIKKLNTKEIYFADFSFGIPLSNTKKLLNLMIENKLNLSWSTYLHPNQFSEELMLLMKNSGCHTIIIGIETADLKSLESYNRSTNIIQIMSLINCCNKIGIDVCADFIIGLPGENIQSINKTIDLSITLKIDYASFNIATPLPGSIFRKQINDNIHQLDSSGLANIFPLAEFTSQELVALKNIAVKKFYMRPGYLIKRLFKTRNFEHFLIQFEEMLSILIKA